MQTLSQFSEEMKEDEDLLRKVHHALMEVHLLEGELICPETGRKFPVRQGVPNMLLHEDGESGCDEKHLCVSSSSAV